MPEPILIAQHGQTQCFLQPDKANRHGLITGATGTGKTITLQTMAEGFAKLGVPVFLATSTRRQELELFAEPTTRMSCVLLASSNTALCLFCVA